jgi:hypothetical protein
MALPKIKSARYALIDQTGDEAPPTSLVGRPALLVDFEDGRELYVDEFPKPLNVGINVVPLGLSEFPDEEVVVTHPTNGSVLRLRGYTDDARLVNMVQQFMIAIQNRTWKPGPVEVPKDE